MRLTKRSSIQTHSFLEQHGLELMWGLSGCNIFAFLSKNSRAARAHREADRKTISCQCNQLSRFFDIFY